MAGGCIHYPRTCHVAACSVVPAHPLVAAVAVTLAVLLLTAAAGMLGVHRQSQLASELQLLIWA